MAEVSTSPSDELTTAEMAAMAELGIDPDQLRASLRAQPRASSVERILSRRALGRAFAVLAAASVAAAGVGLSARATDIQNVHRRVVAAERTVAAAQAVRDHTAEGVERAPLDSDRAWALARSERRLEGARRELAEARKAYAAATGDRLSGWLASSRGLPPAAR